MTSSPVVLAPSPEPPNLPAGYGCLSVTFNRTGPRWGFRFKVSGHETPRRIHAGHWHIPVIAGRHRIKVTDRGGFPLMSTELTVTGGASHLLHFEFGNWRNRIRDGFGRDVTRFGMWGEFTLFAVGLGVGVLALCGIGLAAVLSGL